MNQNIKWLQEWYKNQCNSKWEHDYGITIKTLDNPGWSVEIDLEGVEYDETFQEINIQKSNTDWLKCSIGLNDTWLVHGKKIKQFKASGGWNQLEEIINEFRKIVQRD